MTSKKPARTKRAALPRASDYTGEFLKDWRRLTHSGRYDMRRLKEAMVLLIAGEAPLPPEWIDHALTGEWAGYRECHVGGDFLLVYRIARLSRHEVVVFTRSGSHADLFE